MEGGWEDVAMSSGEEREDDEAAAEAKERLCQQFRLCTISIAEAEAKRNDMEISQPIVACIADLAFKYTGRLGTHKLTCFAWGAEQLAKDLELFAQHAGRKSVNMEDVILSTHRNKHLAATLRSFRDDLKAKEPQTERKSRKRTK
ncbi:unnamed protein product [Cuscuta epithymum]|uniref:Centromere protein S n=1 Tax=Cuscuta epithymum TaxID=186058 RepID=A0AAV0G4A8_9ASTE|nr:unnamed protein product [Cuscuta epithymum]